MIWLTFTRGRSGRAQVEAEQASRAAAKEGLGRRARDAEARAETLAETVEELRAGLERQRGAADYRCADCAPAADPWMHARGRPPESWDRR